MIRVKRPALEPECLAAAELSRLPAVRALAQSGELRARDIDEYDCAKIEYWLAQLTKCAYCEARYYASYADIDHYRPKVTYWWLAWKADNLYFTCPLCNRSGKGDAFPLLRGSPLLPEEPPPQTEEPALLDPAVDDPIEHIQYVPIRTGTGRHWVPVARNGSARGRATIDVLNLDGHQYQTARDHYVVGTVNPLLAEIEEARTAGADDRLRVAWDRATTLLLQPGQLYAALSHDVLDATLPDAVRLQLGLTLPRPGF